MCGRYWIDDDTPEMREIVSEMERSPLTDKWNSPITSFGEIRPTNVVPVIAPDRNGQRAVYPMKWGFNGRSLLINARAETAPVKPTFKEAWRRHRCIVPASWYFEWEHIREDDGRKHTGDKYKIRPADSNTTWLCGLYRIEDGLPVFVILTREPGGEIRFIHDRMPLIMPGEMVNEWIRPDADPDEMMGSALTSMTFEKAAV